MNQRILLFLSVIIIVVGIVGLIKSNDEPVQEETLQTASKNIIIAEAVYDLFPGDIIDDNAFKIKSQQVSEDHDIRDLSAINGNLQGYLVKNKIGRGENILLASLEQPGSEGFIKRSIQLGDVPYLFPVKKNDNEYLLSALNAGDKVAIYLRVIEIEKNKSPAAGLVLESSASGKDIKKYVVNRVFDNLPVIATTAATPETQKTRDPLLMADKEIVGYITIKLSQTQLVKLKTVEKAGELFVAPAGTEGRYVNGKVSMDNVLPQFRTIKEIRGNGKSEAKK
jgi:pilus assembly protein CpaB